MVYHLYETSEFDDLLLWLNKIADIHEMNPGDKILVPIKDDLEDFHQKNRE